VVTREDPFEEADTRTWRTLPDKTLVARLRLKKGEHLFSAPNAPGTPPVTLRIDRDFQVINLRTINTVAFVVGKTYVQTSPAPVSGQK
jgi:hypothetical protein